MKNLSFYTGKLIIWKESSCSKSSLLQAKHAQLPPVPPTRRFTDFHHLGRCSLNTFRFISTFPKEGFPVLEPDRIKLATSSDLVLFQSEQSVSSLWASVHLKCHTSVKFIPLPLSYFFSLVIRVCNANTVCTFILTKPCLPVLSSSLQPVESF